MIPLAHPLSLCVVFSLSFATLKAEAQGFCEAEPLGLDLLPEEPPSLSFQATAVQEQIVIPLQAIRIADDSGGRQAHITPAEIIDWVRFANQVYTPANIRFSFDPVESFTTVRSTLINNMTGTGDSNWDAERKAANQVAAGSPGKMTLIFRWGPSASPTGGGFSWWDYNYVTMPGAYDTWHCGEQNFKTLAHELGHHLGLPHTFGPTFSTVEQAAADFAARGNNRSAYDGDGFSDTPQDPGIYEYECPGPSQVALNGVTFTLPRNNIMSYYYEASTVTAQQIRRIRWLATNYIQHSMLMPSNQGLLNPIEIENLTVTTATGANHAPQDMAGFGRDGWSANRQLWVGANSGGSVTLRFSVGVAGDYDLSLYATKAPDFGIVRAYVNGVAIGSPIDLYAPVVLPTGKVVLGLKSLTAGNHLIRFVATSKNQLSINYGFGLDALRLVPAQASQSPRILSQPFSQTAEANNTATFSVRVEGSEPITFQWRKDGQPIPGANASTLRIPAAQSADAGSYTVQIGNAAGNILSATANLRLNPPPANPFRLEGELLQTVQTSGMAGWIGPQEMGAFGSGWSANKQMFIGLGQSGTATLLLPINRPGTFRLALILTKAPDFGVIQCSLNGQPVGEVIDAYASSVIASGPVLLGTFPLEAGMHRLKLDNVGKNASSSGYFAGVDYISISDETTPSIAQHPQSATISLGQTTTLSVRALGGSPLSYQWLKDGTLLQGETNPSLLVSGTARLVGGNYSVRIKNAAGEITSDPALLRVCVPQKLEMMPLTQEGHVQFRFADTDGQPLSPDDISHFRIEQSTDIASNAWSPAVGTLLLVNGKVQFTAETAATDSAEFFRIMEE